MSSKSPHPFSDKSDVTVVLTSCGRFDLLQKTISSFLDYNTYPIKQFIITEDSGHQEVMDCVPERLRDKFTFLINEENQGQIKSIDHAYSLVTTKYIFHCEDDWEFYRSNFIEDSKKLLQLDSDILQVWLRSYYHDIRIHSGYHSCGERLEHEGIPYYRVLSSKADWQGFSFNPGLRRLSDYLDIGKYGDYDHEKSLSKLYSNKKMWAATLEADAVAHTGFDSHVPDIREKDKKSKRKQKNLFRLTAILAITLYIGYLLGSINAT